MPRDYEANCFQCGADVGLEEPVQSEIFCGADCQIYYEYKRLLRSNIDRNLKQLRWFTIYKISGTIVAIIRAESDLAAEQTLCATDPRYTPDDCASFVTKEIDFPVYMQTKAFRT